VSTFIHSSSEGPTFGTPGNCEFDNEIEAGDEVEIFCAYAASRVRASDAGRGVRHLHAVKVDGTYEDHHDHDLPRLLESPNEQGGGYAYVELKRCAFLSQQNLMFQVVI